MPFVLEVWNAIKTRIATNYAGGFSGLDMTNKVFQGSFAEAPLTPSCYVYFIDSTEQNGQVLTRYQGTARFQVYCFTAGVNNYERAQKAIKLGADVQKQITDDRTLGLTPGRVDNVICSLASLDGDRFGMNTTGIAIVQVDVAFQSDSGV